ncbi:MAG: gamma-glutamyltransferase [Bryobacteraceae bacterium]|nr:gamma-glutamyltransferase [Bryobacteraceae bacterium]
MRFTLLLLALSLPGFVSTLWGQGRSYGRSMVITQQGLVSTSQTLASQAGAQILARGGSAVDAAIAANAVLGVVEPMMCGIGGDLFVLYWEAKTGKLYGLNASGPAPKALSPHLLKSKGFTKMPGDGIHSVTVPGTVEGWQKLQQRFGRLPWKDLFGASIYYAEQGFPVTEVIADSWAGSRDRLKVTPEATRVLLPGGKPPAVGEIFRNPGLGRAMRLIAENGAQDFYRGTVAAAILETSKKLGGVMEASDLAAFSSEWVEPISTEYRGWKVYELPPNGQGMAALEMLNIMAAASPASPEGPHSLSEMHKKIEAMKLAYADLRTYNADPRFARVPVATLLSREYASKRAARIDPKKANCQVPAGDAVASDTTYLTAVDRDGNIASLIQSVSAAFGSGVGVEKMGFLLHNRGAGFTLDPKHPNVLAPGKRPFHTIIPAFMEKGDLHIGFGIMGGPNQPLAHAQFVSHIADYGMNVQEALEKARFTKRDASGCDVRMESRVPYPTVQALSERGHVISLTREHSSVMGRGAAILHNSRTKVNFGAADSRADGSAEPEPVALSNAGPAPAERKTASRE